MVGLRKLNFDVDPTGRRSRLSMELNPYDRVIIHKDSLRHSNADAMPRILVVSSMTPKPFTQRVSVQTDDLPVIFQMSGSVSANSTDCHSKVQSQICLTQGEPDDVTSESTLNVLCTSLGDEGKYICYQKTDPLLSLNLRQVRGKLRKF